MGTNSIPDELRTVVAWGNNAPGDEDFTAADSSERLGLAAIVLTGLLTGGFSVIRLFNGPSEIAFSDSELHPESSNMNPTTTLHIRCAIRRGRKRSEPLYFLFISTYRFRGGDFEWLSENRIFLQERQSEASHQTPTMPLETQ